jgi:hypothetical protein
MDILSYAAGGNRMKGVLLFSISKRFTKWLLVVFVTIIFGSCPPPPPIVSENPVIIHGTVTITRNGIPWNNDNFPDSYDDYYRGAFSRMAPPPRNPYHFSVSAYSASDMGRYITNAWGDYKQNADDLAAGTYKWTMEIPSDKIPDSIIFRVSCDIEGNTSGAANAWKMMDAVYVDGENQIINLGIIDFNILHLSGNLPISINGQPLDDEEYENAWLEVIYHNPYKKYIGSKIHISPDGDWSLNAFVPDTLESLLFQIEVEKNHCIFRRVLNPDGIMTVLDTDQDNEKEISFPSYPSVDFEAFNISGTIKFIHLNPELYSDPSSIQIYDGDGDVDFYSLRTAYIPSYDLQALGDDGLYSWQTMIPAFPIPHNLRFWISGLIIDTEHLRVHVEMTPKSAVINITEDTDLTNIDLGTFTSRTQKTNRGIYEID